MTLRDVGSPPYAPLQSCRVKWSRFAQPKSGKVCLYRSSADPDGQLARVNARADARRPPRREP